MSAGIADGVALALLTSRFERIVRAMINTLVRSGRSGVLNTGRDFSCCILTADHRLLVIGESLPIHIISGPDAMARAVATHFPELRAGDAFLHNSPYEGNSHAADHSLLVPVVDGEGVHRFTVLAKAHQADCGNSMPTTYSTAARDVYDEGALIFPCVKVQEDYRDRADVIRMCEARIRVPDQWHGDYLALVGAARIGQALIGELAAETGWDALDRYGDEWIDYSERRMRQVIAGLHSGTATATSIHDPYPGAPDGVAVKASVEVLPEEAKVVVDLTDNVDCLPCGLNLTEATARTAAIAGVLNSVGSVPANAGTVRRIEVLLRENCVVGIPRHPVSCSAATTNLADRVTNAVHQALAQIAEGMGLAEAGLAQTPAWAVISGNDARHGDAPFVNELVLAAVTGGPATPRMDGWLTYGHCGSAGGVLRDSIELDELRHPVRIHEQRLLADSEGAGRRRGAFAARCEYGPVDQELTLVYNSDGVANPPIGVRGGRAGGGAGVYRRRADGEVEQLPGSGTLRLSADETIVSVSCGGGGYGDPRERERDLVRRDVEAGLVSVGRARELYGLEP